MERVHVRLRVASACLARWLCGLALLTILGSPVAAQELDALADSDRLFQAKLYEEAIKELDRIIPQLEERRKLDPQSRKLLVRALELRARSYFLAGTLDTARVEIDLLLKAFPDHEPAPPPSPFVNLFASVKRGLVGEITLAVTPADASVELDGRLISLAAPSVIPLLAGPHTLAASRLGYRAETRTLSVEAGTRTEVALDLRRTSAVMSVVTEPAGVEVFVNSVSRGTTEARTGTGNPTLKTSRPLSITDLNVGSYTLELRRECFLPEIRRLQIEQLTDIDVSPVVLKPAVAEVTVESEPAGASVMLDGEPQGNAPIVLQAVCEGPHALELRSGTGRFILRLELRAGQRERVSGRVRPAFALLPATGVAEDRGAEYELRLRVERALAETRSVTFVVPTAKEIERALQDARLEPGWLAVDDTGSLTSAGSIAMTSRDRLERGAELARALAVQGITTVNSTTGTVGRVSLAILAMGSGEPDVLDMSLTETDSVKHALALLDQSPVLLTRSAGALLMDVAGIDGALVAAVEPGSSAAAAGLQPADVLVFAGAKPVASVADFERSRDEAALDQPFLIDARRDGQVRRLSLKLTRVPFLMSDKDRTLLFNKLLVERRAADAELTDEFEQSMNGLHQAIALMHGQNWREALGLLERVVLPPGTEIGPGTVAYLRGLCFEGLNQPGSAETAFRLAAGDPVARLTPDGPEIKPLAEAKLAAGASGVR